MRNHVTLMNPEMTSCEVRKFIFDMYREMPQYEKDAWMACAESDKV